MPGTVVTVDDLTESVKVAVPLQRMKDIAATNPLRDGVRGTGQRNVDRAGQPAGPRPARSSRCPLHPSIIRTPRCPVAAVPMSLPREARRRPCWSTMPLAYRASMSSPTPPAGPRFLTLPQAGEELNVTMSQIYALVRSGDLVGIQIGGRNQWRVERSKLEEYIERAYQRTAENLKDLPTTLPGEPE